MNIVEVINAAPVGVDVMGNAYLEICLMTDLAMISTLKNASPEDIRSLNENFQIDISAVVGALNMEGMIGDDINIAPMVAVLEAKNVNDDQYTKLIQAYNEFNEILKKITDTYTAISEPKVKIVEDKIKIIKKYFENKYASSRVGS